MAKNGTVKIAPTRLYRATELEALLGVACMRRLREAGLRAIGDWFLGELSLNLFGEPGRINLVRVSRERRRKVKGARRKRKRQKVLSRKGEFSLVQSTANPRTWEVSFKISKRESSGATHARKRFDAPSLDLARGIAKEKSGVAPAAKVQTHGVGQAFNYAAPR